MVEAVLDKILLNIDSKSFAEKPTSEDVGAIKNRIAGLKREVTPKELFEAIQRGQSFTPAAMDGKDGKSWQSQQVVCADIDNDDDDHNRLPNPLRPEAAQEILKRHGIRASYIYKSFRYRDEWPKYRIVLVLEKPITDKDTAQEATRKLAGLFNSVCPMCADTRVTDPARLFFGSRKDCTISESTERTALEALQALPDPAKVQEPQQPRTRQAPTDNPVFIARDEARQEIRRRWREIIPELARPAKKGVNHEQSYVCPMCGHGKGGDGLTFDPKSAGGETLKCFGCGFSGDIIALYMEARGVDYNEALKGCGAIIGVQIDRDRVPDRELSWNSVISERGADPGEQAAPLYRANEEIIKDYLVFVADDTQSCNAFKEIGFHAIALNGGNLGNYLRGIVPIKNRFILALDNTDEGRARAEDLKEDLTSLGIVYADASADICNGEPSPFFAKNNDAKGFKRRSNAATKDPEWKGMPEMEFDESVTLGELLSMDLPPIEWLVQDYIPKGIGLLAAAPKAGKSLWSLDLAISVAAGIPFMGKTCKAREVLYLDLEGGKVRGQERAQDIIAGKTLTDEQKATAGANLHIVSKGRKGMGLLGAGFEKAIAGEMKKHPGVELLIIDVYQKVRGIPSRFAQIYTQDYEDVRKLRAIETEYNISILIVHHTRKPKGNELADPFELISGSTGLFGAVDYSVILTCKRDKSDARFYISGNDLRDEYELAARFDRNKVAWIIEGDVETVQAQKEMDAYLTDPIITVIKKMTQTVNPWEFTYKQFAATAENYNVWLDTFSRKSQQEFAKKLTQTYMTPLSFEGYLVERRSGRDGNTYKISYNPEGAGNWS